MNPILKALVIQFSLDNIKSIDGEISFERKMMMLERLNLVVLSWLLELFILVLALPSSKESIPQEQLR